MGADNVVGVKVDSRGKMDIEQLKLDIENAIRNGKEPFLVAATAGRVGWHDFSTAFYFVSIQLN